MNRLPLLLCAAAVLAALSFGFYFHRTATQAQARETTAKAQQVAAQRRADSLQTELATAAQWAAADILHSAGIEAGKKADADEVRIRATPAAGWADDSLARFLANPSGHDLHAPGAGSPQRR